MTFKVGDRVWVRTQTVPIPGIYQGGDKRFAIVLTKRGIGLNLDYTSCPQSWVSARTSHVPELDGEEPKA